jgi:hypothetical protein
MQEQEQHQKSTNTILLNPSSLNPSSLNPESASTKILTPVEEQTPLEELPQVEAAGADDHDLAFSLYNKNFPVIPSDIERMKVKVAEVVDYCGYDLFKNAVDRASGASPPPVSPLNYIKGIADRLVEQEIRENGLT